MQFPSKFKKSNVWRYSKHERTCFDAQHPEYPNPLLHCGVAAPCCGDVSVGTGRLVRAYGKLHKILKGQGENLLSTPKDLELYVRASPSSGTRRAATQCSRAKRIN